ncbi:MAG: hypothetical protein A2V88_12255 [Elusimicrobia bacterium RBG_16_66_12]|nr:MAG: hypothetical protein A2V88_12255 [Elusimicrobia bacterium RBG_16_66_12]
MNILWAVVGQFVKCGGGLLQAFLGFNILRGEQITKATALGLIPLPQKRASLLVVPLDRSKSIVGQTGGNQFWRGPKQAIAHTNVMVEE